MIVKEEFKEMYFGGLMDEILDIIALKTSQIYIILDFNDDNSEAFDALVMYYD